MRRVRCDIGKVIVLLYENYKKAEQQEFVQKPISYALFYTWKYVDSIVKESRLTSQRILWQKQSKLQKSAV